MTATIAPEIDDVGRPPRRVAVMQPYLYPYAGYFRLLHAVDEFVIFDCVQFPRRGRVHRCAVPDGRGGETWLTLPLARHPVETRIADLRFAPDARPELDGRLARLPWFREGRGPAADAVRAHLAGPLDDPVDFLEAGIRLVADRLGLHPVISRSSALDLPDALRGQDRVLAAALARGATSYVNAPGGVALYDPDRFAAAGVELWFLHGYHGPYRHLLPALLREDPAAIAADVRATSTLGRAAPAATDPEEDPGADAPG